MLLYHTTTSQYFDMLHMWKKWQIAFCVDRICVVDRIVTRQSGAACGCVEVFLVLYNYIKVCWAQPFYQDPCLVVKKKKSLLYLLLVTFTTKVLCCFCITYIAFIVLVINGALIMWKFTVLVTLLLSLTLNCYLLIWLSIHITLRWDIPVVLS
jgi:hypothetical protein